MGFSRSLMRLWVASCVFIGGGALAQESREERSHWLKEYFQSNQGKLLIAKSPAVRHLIVLMAEGCASQLQDVPLEAFLASVAAPTSRPIVVDSSSAELIERLKLLQQYLPVLEDHQTDPWNGESAKQYNSGVEAPLLRVAEFFFQDFQAVSREFLLSVSQREQQERYLEIIDKVLKDPDYAPGDMELGFGTRAFLKSDNFPVAANVEILASQGGPAHRLRVDVLEDQKFFTEKLKQPKSFSNKNFFRHYFDFSIVVLYHALDRVLTTSSFDLGEDPIYLSTINAYLIYLTNYLENLILVSGQKKLKRQVRRFVTEDLRILLAVSLEVSINATLPSLLNRVGASFEIKRRLLAVVEVLDAEN